MGQVILQIVLNLRSVQRHNGSQNITQCREKYDTMSKNITQCRGKKTQWVAKKTQWRKYRLDTMLNKRHNDNKQKF